MVLVGVAFGILSPGSSDHAGGRPDQEAQHTHGHPEVRPLVRYVYLAGITESPLTTSDGPSQIILAWPMGALMPSSRGKGREAARGKGRGVLVRGDHMDWGWLRKLLPPY